MKTFEEFTEGSLHKWFKGSKSKDGKGGWVNVVTGGTCASDKPGEGTPKCVSSAKRASMTKAERASAARRKKAADPGQQSKSGAAKPTYVSTDKPKKKVSEAKELKTVAKELEKASKLHKGQSKALAKASKMHKGQSEKIKKHLGDMEECWKTHKKVGMKMKGGKLVPDCRPKNEEVEIDEACWKGYEKKGMKTMFGKRYPNCVKKKKTRKEEVQVDEAKVEAGRSDYGKASVRNKRKFGKEGEPAVFDASGERGKMIDKRREEHKAKRGVKEGKGYQPEIEHSKMGDAKKKADKKRESNLPPHLQGDAIGKMKKAFASTNEEVEMQEATPAWQRKEGKRESGGLNQKGVDSYRRANPGSKLKTAVTTKPSKLKKGSKSAKRRKSFCARMKGMKSKLTSAKTARDPDSRINKSLRKWNCSYEPEGTPIMEKEDKAFNFVLDKIRKEVGKSGYVSKDNPRKPQSAAEKAKVRAHQAKVDKENAAARAKDPSQGRYPKG